MCMHYIDDLYHNIMHHDYYVATGDVVKFFILHVCSYKYYYNIIIISINLHELGDQIERDK